MKKKVLFIVLCSFLLTGVVSAASLWGNYKGNPIVKLNIDGATYKPPSVPAIAVNGQTMIPVNVLSKLGVNFSYDKKSQTINIQSPTPSPVQSVPAQTANFNPTQRTQEIISLGGGGVTIVNINGESTAMSFYSAKSNFDGDWQDLNQIFMKLIDFGSVYSRVVYSLGQQETVVEIRTSDLKDYMNGFISDEELQKRWIIQSPTNSVIPGGNAGSVSTTITSKIKDEFEGFENDALFELDNGQIWKQTSFDFKYTYKYRPEVTIFKDGPYYYMIVDGIDDKVRVEQIK